MKSVYVLTPMELKYQKLLRGLLKAAKLSLEVRSPFYPGAVSDREADDKLRVAIAKAEASK